MAQGTQLMRSAAEGDSALLLGGDLIVTVHQAEQLCGQERLTHPFARVCAPEVSTGVLNMHPPAAVVWQSADRHMVAVIWLATIHVMALSLMVKRHLLRVLLSGGRGM